MYGFKSALWENPVRYIDSSPLRHLDKVRTPLLIMHGEEDTVFLIGRAEETFRGLQYLDRPVIFARIAREGHGLSGQQEIDRRTMGWLREHLLGGPPVTQTADQGSFFLDGSRN